MDLQFRAQIKAAKVSAKDGPHDRSVVLTMARPFDDDLAYGLGGDARMALESLRSGGMASCVLPIDAVKSSAKLVAESERVMLPFLNGLKATAKAGGEEGPMISLEFEAPWSETAWLFLGRNAGVAVDVELRDKQLDLPGTTAVERAALEFVQAVKDTGEFPGPGRTIGPDGHVTPPFTAAERRANRERLGYTTDPDEPKTRSKKRTPAKTAPKRKGKA